MEEFNVISLPPGSWLITLEKSAMSGTVLIFAAGRLTLKSGQSQVSLSKGESMLLTPSLHLPFLPPCHFVHQSIGWWQGWLGKKLTGIPEWVILSTWLLKSSFAEVTLWWTFKGRQISSHISCSFREFYLPCHQFSNCSFQVPGHPAKPLAAADELVYSLTSRHFSFQTKWITRCAVQSPGKISLHHCPSGMSKNEARMLQLSTLGWYLHIKQEYLWARPKSSLYQLAVGNSVWGHST